LASNGFWFVDLSLYLSIAAWQSQGIFYRHKIVLKPFCKILYFHQPTGHCPIHPPTQQATSVHRTSASSNFLIEDLNKLID
jgi:hypothetical protein